MDHLNDAVLSSLERIAKNGGERGEYYDRGTLSVIAKIRSSGKFVPDKALRIVANLPASGDKSLLSEDQINAALETIGSLGMASGDAKEYACGVIDAEEKLKHYQMPEA